MWFFSRAQIRLSTVKPIISFVAYLNFLLRLLLVFFFFFKAPIKYSICAKNTIVEYRGSVFSPSLANFLKFGILHSSGLERRIQADARTGRI
ncbi:hypothetical protein CY35_15G023500 [Sphagnum magellanicum]|nr:hypothetical protein CY35_15G023500 [Sphagnum magellanicum]KAH9538772.1 hypothetical protein CY35_15G023500 [Sphagnum magellanicum]